MKHSVCPIVISAPVGLLPFTAIEVASLGYQVLWKGESSLGIKAGWGDVLRLNLWLRTAHHVFFQLDDFLCRDLDELYKRVATMPWESVIAPDGYLSVTATVDQPGIRDHRIVNVKCKDAIVDRISRVKGRRPDSGAQRDGTVIAVFWKKHRCSISIDTSGEPLTRRGYRTIPLNAPMQETLAAGVVMASRFSKGENFINPMCGSGTIAIEAALIASGKAPGLTRENFGFMHTLLYGKTEWDTLVADARMKCSAVQGTIIATDNDPAAIDATRRNAAAAGVERYLSLAAGEFDATELPAGTGAVVINPEYGIRLGEERLLVDSYRSIGKFLKQKCAGYRGYVFTGNARLAGNVGLKSGKKIKFLNGTIPCRLYEYELFPGHGK
ncbi:MAG: hypothetical protein JW863_15420 [Chitinispirillaceae bacterium]|nr:hypothetical protein [Chitinispirillaceae bacterium]